MWQKRLATIIVLGIIAHFFIYPHGATAVSKKWKADGVFHQHYTIFEEYCYGLVVVIADTMEEVESGSHWDTYHASGVDSESHDDGHKTHLDVTIVDTIAYVYFECPG